MERHLNQCMYLRGASEFSLRTVTYILRQHLFPEAIWKAKLILYAEDMLLNMTVDSSYCWLSPTPAVCSSGSQPLLFNVSKCKSMVITRKRNLRPPTMTHYN